MGGRICKDCVGDIGKFPPHGAVPMGIRRCTGRNIGALSTLLPFARFVKKIMHCPLHLIRDKHNFFMPPVFLCLSSQPVNTLDCVKCSKESIFPWKIQTFEQACWVGISIGIATDISRQVVPLSSLPNP